MTTTFLLGASVAALFLGGCYSFRSSFRLHTPCCLTAMPCPLVTGSLVRHEPLH